MESGQRSAAAEARACTLAYELGEAIRKLMTETLEVAVRQDHRLQLEQRYAELLAENLELRIGLDEERQQLVSASCAVQIRPCNAPNVPTAAVQPVIASQRFQQGRTGPLRSQRGGRFGIFIVQ